MGYIGPIPAQVPLTSSDIEDGIITADKLATDSVETVKVKDVNITAGKLAATQDLSSKTITLPATVAGLGTGINVTNQITGKVPAANLGTGTASATTYLAGDQSYKALSEFDDDALRNDIATLALHQATFGNAAKYNLVNTNVDQYEDSTGVATFTDCSRNSDEYVSSVVAGQGRFTSDANTSLLIHSDTTDGNTTFTDSSSNAHTITQFGAGNVENSTDYPPPTYLGTTAIHNTGGASGIKAAASSDWNFGTGEFCIEAWVYSNGTPPSSDRQVSLSGSDEWFFRPSWTTGSWIRLNLTTGGMYSSGAYGSNPMIDTWTHFAYCRDGNIFRVYVDGVHQTFGIYPLTAGASYSMFTDSKTFDMLGEGAAESEYATANTYFTELRVSKGVSRYPNGTTFTPNDVETENATGNYISTATTSLTSVSTMGAVIIYKNSVGTNALNTDIVLEVSANGGTNYTTVVLEAGGTFSTGILQAVANDITVTPGTSIQYRISFANQAVATKIAQIHGASLMY